MTSACANLQKVINAGVHAYFGGHLAETERLLVNNNQRVFYKHLTSTVELEGTTARSYQLIRDKDGTVLMDKVRFVNDEREFATNSWNTKSLKLDPTVIDLLPPRPPKLSLEDEPSVTGALKGVSNWKAVGSDGLPAELLKIDHPVFAQFFHNILGSVWFTGVPQQGPSQKEGPN